MADESNVGLIVPWFEELPAFYQAADQMGFHSLWVTEMLFSHGGVRGSWTPLGGATPFVSWLPLPP